MKVTRQYDNEVTLVTREDGTSHLEGYALRFWDGTAGTEYALSPGKVERIKREDIDATLAKGSTVQLKYNHDRNFVLDSTDATLVLRTDDKGLAFSCPFDESDPDFKKVQSKLTKGIIKGCSFGGDGRHRWEREGEKVVGYLTDLTLDDVSVVNKPAYQSTYCIVRDDELKAVEADYEAFVRESDPQIVEDTPDVPIIDEEKVTLQRDLDESKSRVVILEDRVQVLERMIEQTKEKNYLNPQSLPSFGVKGLSTMSNEALKTYWRNL